MTLLLLLLLRLRSALLILFLFPCFSFPSTEAFDPLDPNGNITIKWDVMSWTPDGYVAVVTINNFQQFRHIQPPGWSLHWTWAGREVIWAMVGAQTTEQGNCSSFKGNIPHSCQTNPTVVDLLPNTPYNQQVANCCKGGIISSWLSDPENSASTFQISVGDAGTTNRTVQLPKNFTLKAPGPGYTCGPARIARPTRFITPDGRRVTQALMTWQVVCTYSQFLERKFPSCCVSLSSYYNNTVAPCPTCTCGCPNKNNTETCVHRETGPFVATKDNSISPIVECTRHMCPTRVHWHVEKANENKFWRVKLIVTNLDYRMNNTDWNLALQYSNFDKLVKVFNFNFKNSEMFLGTNDTMTILWGSKKKKNDAIIRAGLLGGKNYVQSELLFRKEKSEKGWAFPRRIIFNGANCIMPAPDVYPYVPDTITSS